MNPFTRILEDDEDDRDFIRHGLAGHGLVDTVDYFLYATSKELLEQIDESTTVVVLDWRLDEGASGVDILLKLRLSRKREDLFVIMITGRIDEDVVEDFFNSGADFFVRKKGRNWTDKLAVGIRAGDEHIRKQLTKKREHENDKEKLMELFKGIENRINKL